MKWAPMTAGIALAVMFCAAIAAAPDPAPPVPQGNATRGKQVYANANPKCSLCHKIGASGGKLGPELTGVATRRDRAWLLKYLPNPQGWDPLNKMPPVSAKGQDLEDLVAYLLTLKGK
jgi:cytochrome c2